MALPNHVLVGNSYLTIMLGMEEIFYLEDEIKSESLLFVELL
jgi:hypothetical protein